MRSAPGSFTAGSGWASLPAPSDGPSPARGMLGFSIPVFFPRLVRCREAGVAEKENFRVKLDTACGNNLFLYPGSWQKGLSTAAGFEACLHSNKLLHSIHF